MFSFISLDLFLGALTGFRSFDRRELKTNFMFQALQTLFEWAFGAALLYRALTFVFRYKIFHPDLPEWGLAIYALIVVDFTHYVAVFDHNTRWGWAMHVLHHTPKRINFSVGFRLGIPHVFCTLSILLVVACWITGLAPQIILTAYVTNLVYQFCSHTELIPRMRWVEYVFSTPSTHRVHHALNPEYVNRNFGGMFTVFDRLFGTFREEDDAIPLQYGLNRTVPEKFHLLLFMGWYELIRDAFSQAKWRLNQYGAVRILSALALLYFFISLEFGAYTVAVFDQEIWTPLLRLMGGVGIFGALLFLLGIFSRFGAVLGLICLNVTLLVIPPIAELHYPYLSLILCVYAIFSTQPWTSWKSLGLQDDLREQKIWYLPLFYSVFLGFTLLGINKFFLPVWWTGDVVRLLCPSGPIGIHAAQLCDWLPRKALSYYVLFAEAASLPLALHPRTRPLAWALNVFLHIGIWQFMYARRISYVTLVLLLFLFDQRWLKHSVWPKSSIEEYSR